MLLAERLQPIRFSDAKGPPLYQRVYEGYPLLTRLRKGGPFAFFVIQSITSSASS